MISLLQRHLKMFFLDKMNVFFSLMSVLIIIGLYIFFLSENIMQSMPKFDDAKEFTFLWLVAGIIAVTTGTTTLGALGKFLEDKISEKKEDFLITDITYRQLTYSYLIYTIIVGIIFTVVLFLIAYVYMYFVFSKVFPLSVTAMIAVFLSILMHAMMLYFIITKLHSMNAYSGFATIYGTLVGFLAGIYIPVGMLPEYVQKVITLFPTTQVAVILREEMLVHILTDLQTHIPTDSYDSLMAELGITLQWNDQLLPSYFPWLYLVVFTFILLAIMMYRKN